MRARVRTYVVCTYVVGGNISEIFLAFCFVVGEILLEVFSVVRAVVGKCFGGLLGVCTMVGGNVLEMF